MAGIQWLRKGMSVVLVGCFVLAAPLGSVQAGLVTTETALGASTPDSSALRAELRAELVAHGVDADEASTRVAALSDAEVTRVAGQLDELPAGGSSILGVIALVAIGLAITDWFGLTNVYPWVKPRQEKRY